LNTLVRADPGMPSCCDGRQLLAIAGAVMSIWSELATWRGPTPSHGGPMVEQRGLVVHIAEGSFEGTIDWQRDPANEVSSHFVVDLDGSIAQVIDTEVAAWTQRAGNGHWLSVENAGHTPHPLTDAQIDANARLLARAHQQYGVPLAIATCPDERGLGHHSMGAECGVDWGHSQCPGPAIKAQKPLILARAIAIVNGDDMTPAQAYVQHYTEYLVAGLVGNTDPIKIPGRPDLANLGSGQPEWAQDKFVPNRLAQAIAGSKPPAPVSPEVPPSNETP
jgi:N-acetylmuramoyl-L-alanine amidase-like protein